MYDSVFDNLKKTSDKLIFWEKQVLDDLSQIESKSTALLTRTVPVAISQLNINLNSDNFFKIAKRIVFQKISQALWATWLSAWQLGEKHGVSEFRDILSQFSNSPNIAEFADGTQKKGVQAQSIRNKPAERAIKARINQLARDVTNSEFENIQKHLLAAVAPQPDTGEPISRKELLERIEEALGTKSGRFAKRAQTIARTELTFAYNAGRLETYRESGLVTHVCFYTISDERRCAACFSRQGLIIPLDDWQAIAQNSPPVHVNCRCVWSPIFGNDPRLKERSRFLANQNLVPRPAPWAASAILASVLLGGGKGSSAAIALATNQIKEAIQEKPAVPVVQKQERQGQISPSSSPVPVVQIGSLNLNTATREELQHLLPGRSLNIRQVNEIIRRREKKAFTSVDELKAIPGIGGKTFEKLRQLAEGSAIIPLLNPQNIRTPAQLWASNLGITKSQAETIFKEMQKGAFRDVEDLKLRLKGKGIGEQTIKSMQERAVIIRQRVDGRRVTEQEGYGV